MNAEIQDLMLAQATIENLPKMLTDLRKRYDITQNELATELGITAHAVSNDERGGYTSASLDRLKRVMEALIKLANERKSHD